MRKPNSVLIRYLYTMNSVIFTEYRPKKEKPFDRLFSVFMELLLISSGDLGETMDWLRELNERYSLTDEAYTMDDFLEELRTKGYLGEGKPGETGEGKITPKTEQHFRSRALEELFGKLKKGGKGNHATRYGGQGADEFESLRPFEFGDAPGQIAYTESLKNAWIRSGISGSALHEQDLEIREHTFQTSASTVLLIDISHSMILYGEDRITPAKKVALALAEFIRIKYPKDSLDIVAFGNDARLIPLRDLPYLKVGPFHTNTVAALEAAEDILRKRKNPNKQIIMVTDGKPTCLKESDGTYYKNSFGLDERIIAKTLHLAQDLKKKKIPVTTFMIASDNYLREFVHEFTEINKGKAYYTTPDGLGSLLFEDFEKNRKKNL
jgi:Ca-activated chloride channel family protein